MDRRRRIFSESGRALPDSRQRAAGVLVRQRGTVDQTLFQRQRSAGAGTAETLFAGKCPADPQFSRPERFADGLPAPPQNWTKCPVLRIFRHFFPRKRRYNSEYLECNEWKAGTWIGKSTPAVIISRTPPNDARNAAAHGPGPAIAWSLPMRLRFLERLLPGIPPFLRQDSVGVSSHVPGVCPHLFPRIPQVSNQ